MVVKTDSPIVHKAREGVMEFLLAVSNPKGLTDIQVANEFIEPSSGLPYVYILTISISAWILVLMSIYSCL